MTTTPTTATYEGELLALADDLRTLAGRSPAEVARELGRLLDRKSPDRLERRLNAARRAAVQQVVDELGGSQVRAARLLGISEQTVSYVLVRLR